jgi:antitoxin (DNA-binding transcriptional repressor) of toxin-antitoxin stability system
MKMLAYDKLARDFPKTWATVEAQGEEVVVTRGRRRVACIVPELPPATALEVFADLHGLLGEQAGAAVAATFAAFRNERSHRQTLEELRDPWAS